MKKIFIGIYLLTISTISNAQIQQLTKLVATDRAAGNQLGSAVAISGNYAVVGAADISEGNIQNSGQCAYVFERSADGNWKQIQKLVAADNASGDNFGRSVSISGNYIVIGAPGKDNGTGVAYIFERNSFGSWLQVKKIIAHDRSGVDLFGSTVSVSENYIIIGAPNDAEDAAGANPLTAAGSAYFFTRNTSGSWDEVNKIEATDRATGVGFGASVSISGTYVVVGAPFEKRDTTGSNVMDGAGAAYIFQRNAKGLMAFVHKLVNWDRAAGDQFGYSVSMNGDKMAISSPFEDEDANQTSTLISAGSVHVFQKQSDGRWWWAEKLVAPDRTAGDNFGFSVNISGDMLIVGTPAEDEIVGGDQLNSSGAAYLFRLSLDSLSSGWRILQKITATDGTNNDWFGYTVAVDNHNMLVGAPFQDRNQTRLIATDAGAAYIFGRSACINSASSISAQTCKTYTSPSKKHVWTRSGTYSDTLLNKAGCDSILTINLTITTIADTLVTKKGHALTANAKDASYQWIDCATNQPINVTTRSLIVTGNGSYKVAIDQNGCVGTSSCHNVVLIATPNSPVVITTPVVLPKNASTQKAFLEVNKIVANDRTHNDEFGRSVSLSGNYAVIGVPTDDEDENGKNGRDDAGSAYIFKLDDGGKWKQLQKIVAGDRAAGDNFGHSVGISGGYIVVGAWYDHKNAAGIKDNNLSGSAYIFELNQNGTWYQKQKITADAVSRGGQEYFGTAVAIEGTTIVVSAPDHAKDVTNSLASNITAAGALYVFDRTGTGWIQTQKLVANDRELGSWLGNSVAICGNNIIAGAWGGDYDANRGNRMEAAGAAYIFERGTGSWKVQKIVASDRSPHDEYGFSVAISGQYAVVGARRVTEKKEDEDNGQYTGNAYVYKREADKWVEVLKINPDDRTKEDYLGAAVGISGNYLIVSAPGQDTDSLGNYMANAGAIYVYYLDKSGNWILSDKISTFLKHQLDGFGFAAAISDCKIIGTSYIDQTDEEDKNAITNTGSASIFTAAACNNDGRCSGRLFPWDKTPIDKQTKESSNAKMPGKVQPTDTNGKGNEVTAENQVLTDDGLKKTDERKKTKTDPVKKIKNLIKNN